MLAEGGARRPSVHPELAAWRVATSAHVVGACPACGQPLVSDGQGERIPWTVRLPDGEAVTVQADGTVADRADERVRAAYPTGLQLADLRPGLALFQGSLLTLMLGPVVLWVLAVIAVVVFLTHFGTPVSAVP